MAYTAEPPGFSKKKKVVAVPTASTQSPCCIFLFVCVCVCDKQTPCGSRILLLSRLPYGSILDCKKAAKKKNTNLLIHSSSTRAADFSGSSAFLGEHLFRHSFFFVFSFLFPLLSSFSRSPLRALLLRLLLQRLVQVWHHTTA